MSSSGPCLWGSCGVMISLICMFVFGIQMLTVDPKVEDLQKCTCSFVRRSILSPWSSVYGSGEIYHGEYYAYAYNCQGSLKSQTSPTISDEVIAEGLYINITLFYPPPPSNLNTKTKADVNALIGSLTNQDKICHVSGTGGNDLSRGTIYGAWIDGPDTYVGILVGFGISCFVFLLLLCSILYLWFSTKPVQIDNTSLLSEVV